jgi:hypothetical protein
VATSGAVKKPMMRICPWNFATVKNFETVRLPIEGLVSKQHGSQPL